MIPADPSLDPAAWAREVMATMDSLDVTAIAALFAEDGALRYANGKPVVGREAIARSLGRFTSALARSHHDVEGVWTGRWADGAVVSIEGIVTYTRADGSTTPPLPVTSTARVAADGLIADYRVFMDATPLAAG